MPGEEVRVEGGVGRSVQCFCHTVKWVLCIPQVYNHLAGHLLPLRAVLRPRLSAGMTNRWRGGGVGAARHAGVLAMMLDSMDSFS